MNPPRTVEALLEALGADTQYRDAVLGDLAEEFASRAERDGEDNARGWYRHEAMRAVPHLLRSGWHRARRRGIGHLLGVMITAYTGVFIIGIVGLGIVGGTLRVLGLVHVPEHLPIANPLFQGSMIVLGTLSATTGGYLAAWLDEDAPLLTAFAFGIMWSALEALGLMITGGLSLWCRMAVPVAILVGTSCGGALRVRRRTHDQSAIVGRD
jgi:hypothetical protein